VSLLFLLAVTLAVRVDTTVAGGRVIFSAGR
jgi:hypothetical protein